MQGRADSERHRPGMSSRMDGWTHPSSRKTSRLLLCSETWACFLKILKRKATCSGPSRCQVLQSAWMIRQAAPVKLQFSSAAA